MEGFLKKKLVSSLLAALLIIALLKVKLLFLAPLLLGVSTAKKLLLKVLLFLFPALAHLFKLCAYYHHHHSKYHLHHHHQVAHHHHHVPVHQEHVYPGEHPDYFYHHRSETGESEPGYLTSWGIETPTRVPETATVATQHEGWGDTRVSASYHPDRTYSLARPVVDLSGWDPFYSGILVKVDEVFSTLGFSTEPCRRRLVCSIYKAPQRFSPHSNLLSAQLSRDPSELERPNYVTEASTRFQSYVDAARRGQAGQDCLALYPGCPLLTE